MPLARMRPLILTEMLNASIPTHLFRDVLQNISASNRTMRSFAAEKGNRYVAGTRQGLADIFV